MSRFQGILLPTPPPAPPCAAQLHPAPAAAPHVPAIPAVMKFGKLLESATSGLPECDGMMLRYKQLKKQLKAMKASGAASEGQKEVFLRGR